MSAPDPAGIEARWRRRFARVRLRLGVEPIAEQVERSYRVAWAITGVTSFIGLFLFTLLAWRGGSPKLGAVVAGVIAGPILAGAWLGHARRARCAARYLRETAGSVGPPS